MTLILSDYNLVKRTVTYVLFSVRCFQSMGVGPPQKSFVILRPMSTCVCYPLEYALLSLLKHHCRGGVTH